MKTNRTEKDKINFVFIQKIKSLRKIKKNNNSHLMNVWHICGNCYYYFFGLRHIFLLYISKMYVNIFCTFIKL